MLQQQQCFGDRRRTTGIRAALIVVLSGLLLGGLGCSAEIDAPLRKFAKNFTFERDGYGEVGEIKFLDDTTTQELPEVNFADLVFTRENGEQVPLKDFVGQKPLALVITKGFYGAICPYCSTQVSRLIAAYPQFQQRGAEIVVVYPLETPDDRPAVPEFMKGVWDKDPKTQGQLPFPFLLDVELHAVDQLGLRRNLSKPATYLLDANGRVRFAYVGESLADRPSVKAMLVQLDEMQKSAVSEPAASKTPTAPPGTNETADSVDEKARPASGRTD